MPPYTITYFPVQGRCKAIRILLADKGQQWQEKCVSMEDWQQGDLKAKCVFGQLPKLEDGDLTLFQSNAMLRYLGRKHDAYGSNDKEAALIDMFVDGVEDLRLKYVKLIYQEYETGKEKYLKDLPCHISKFEAALLANKTGFLVGDKVSIADYSLFDIMLSHYKLCEGSCKGDKFPNMKAFMDKMSSCPNIKKYLESEAYKKLPLNGNGKQ